MQADTNIGRVSKADPRTNARLLAVQYLFSEYFSNKQSLTVNFFEPNTILSIIDEDKFDHRLYETLVDGVDQNDSQIIDIIKSYAKSWPIDQISTVDLCILKIGVYEAFIQKITPPKVVINECVEIAKIVSSDSAAKFVNGVLGKILEEDKVL